MKRILFQIVLLAVFPAFAACGAGTTDVRSTDQARAALNLPEQPDSSQLVSIVQATRVWGFAKYRHPAFASRSGNADAAYFRLLDEILQVPDSARNGICARWISSLGPYAVRDGKEKRRLEAFNDFRWIADSSVLGKELSESLLRLGQADPEGNRYAEQTPVNVSFREPRYPDIPEEDVAYRLLGVAKFWNAVDSYSPNRNLTDRPWDEVLAEYVALAFDRSVSFSSLYSKMVSELCDTHVNSWYIPIFGGRFAPVVARFAEDRLFVADTCSLVVNDFRVGDEILFIDSLSPLERLEQIAPYLPHSNRSSLLRNGASAVLLTAREAVRITYRREGQVHTAEIPSVEGEKFVGRIHSSLFSSSLPTFEEVAEGIACVRIGGLTCADREKLEEVLESCDKLILDMRAYPAEYDVIYKLLPDYFFARSAVAAEVLLPQADRPGCFVRRQLSTGVTSDQEKLYRGKVVLLVDACSQSMAEYFTMFLQTVPGAVTMGSRTAGADGDVTRIQLPYASFNLTGAGICYPDGTNAQRAGVKIDVVAEPSAEGMMRGEDEQLQAAVRYLLSSAADAPAPQE